MRQHVGQMASKGISNNVNRGLKSSKDLIFKYIVQDKFIITSTNSLLVISSKPEG